jgi:hypothetical protein
MVVQMSTVKEQHYLDVSSMEVKIRKEKKRLLYYKLASSAFGVLGETSDGVATPVMLSSR